MPKPFLSPLNDAVFKMLFGDSRDVEHLTNFLKSTLAIPAKDYEEVTLADPHLARDAWNDKLSILDVKLKTCSSRVKSNWPISPICEPYRTIQPAICILITDFTLIRENSNCHNRYRL